MPRPRGLTMSLFRHIASVPAPVPRLKWGLWVLRERDLGRGMTFGAVTKAALPLLASAAFFFQSTGKIAYQDTASLLTSGIAETERWMVHVKAPPVSSDHAATKSTGTNSLSPNRQTAAYEARVPAQGTDLSDVIQSDRTTGAIINASLRGFVDETASTGRIGDDPVFPEVNRAGKGDFLMSRHRNDLIRDVEKKPNVFRRFSAVLFSDEVETRQVASFASPEATGNGGQTMMAMLPNFYSDFVKGGRVHEPAGRTMLAALPPQRPQNTGTGTLVPVIYAALVPRPNLPKVYQEAEEAARAAVYRLPEPRSVPDESWKDGESRGKIKYSRRELHCLATAVYFEARGESHKGQLAVAQVIINRTKSKHWPDTICGVVYQNKSWRNRCQFSFACDGKADKIRDRKAWTKARAVAQKFANGYVMRGINRATHYHATYVRPRWARHFRKIDKVGTHIFYRSRTGGWS